MRFVKRTIVTLVIVAMAGLMPVVANAQTVFSPSVTPTRHDDVINKTISDSVHHTICNKDGLQMADKAYFMADPLPLVFVQGRKGTIDFVPVNVLSEHLKWGMIPDTSKLASKTKTESVRNDGGRNHTRKVMEFGFREMDLITLGNSQNMFSDTYDVADLDNVRTGNNSLFLRDETAHDSRITLGPIDGTKKGRNFLNDLIPVIVVPRPKDAAEQANLVLLLKRCGYRFRDPKVDAQLTQLAAGQPLAQESSGTDDHQGDTSLSKKFKLEGLDAPAVKVSINDNDLTDSSAITCVAGDKMTIALPGKFRVTISQIINGKVAEKAFFDRQYEDERWISLDLTANRQYEVVVTAHGQVCRVQRLVIKAKEDGQ